MLRQRKLYNIHPFLHLILPSKEQPLLLHCLLVDSIELIAMSMPLLDFGCAAIQCTTERLLWPWEFYPAGTQSHVAPHCVLGNLWHEFEDVMLGLLLPIKLFTRSISVAELISRVLNESNLHSEADSQVGFLPRSGKMSSMCLSIDASVSKSAWNQDPIALAELLLCLRHPLSSSFQLCRINPSHLEFSSQLHSSMVQGTD
mmetsp:Transcript_43258/g.78731  ORF Transcript_43258/g.78731 Transcript_43258/m.78731 type:complete len:201 (-) Transcript_43258:1275-1877(-)